jgi:hypothetical protein
MRLHYIFQKLRVKLRIMRGEGRSSRGRRLLPAFGRFVKVSHNMRLFPVLLTLVGLCTQANAAITLVAHRIAKDLTGAESYAMAAPGYESKAGNFIAVWAVSYSGADPVGPVTDSAGNTYKPAGFCSGTWNGQWFYASNVKGDSFNVVTIRPKTTGRATFKYPGMIVLEYSGVDKAAVPVLDAAGQQGSLNGAWTSAKFNASAGELVLVGIVTANGGNYTPGAEFQMQESYFTPSSRQFSFAVFDRVFAAAQSSVTATVSWTGTFQTTGAVLSFRPAGP